MPTKNESNPTDSESEVRRTGQLPRFPVWLLILLLVVSGLYYSWVDAEFSVSGKPTLDMLVLAGVLNVLVFYFIRTSDWTLGWQKGLLLGLGIVQAMLVGTVQVEGIYGNGRPVFNWRWARLPADRTSVLELPDGGSQGSAGLSLPANGEWPGFRGKDRLGVADLDLAKYARPFAEKWRRPIGAGWSSFAIAGRYCFTMEQRSELECTTCYDLETGQQLWIHQQPERFREISGGEGPRATPEYVDGLLYTLGATGVLNCLDATTGKVLWSQDVLRAFDATNCLFGACCSPLVVGDLLLVNPGGKNASVVAFNRMNGDLIWQAGDAEASYASLCCMTFDGVKQVLHFNAEGLDAHDLETGAILWSVPWISNEEERNNVLPTDSNQRTRAVCLFRLWTRLCLDRCEKEEWSLSNRNPLEDQLVEIEVCQRRLFRGLRLRVGRRHHGLCRLQNWKTHLEERALSSWSIAIGW